MLFRKGGIQLALILEALHWLGALGKNNLSVLMGYEEGWVTGDGRKKCQPSLI